MSDLISRCELFNRLAPVQTLGEAYGIIQEMPTVDAVPVVRCAVCRYFRCNMRGDGTLPNGVDEFECVLGRGGYDPMDFCSEGERKDGDHAEGTV